MTLKILENKILVVTKAWTFTKKFGVIIGSWLLIFIISYFLIVSKEYQTFATAADKQNKIVLKLNQEQKQIPKLQAEKADFLQLQIKYSQYARLLNKNVKISAILQYLMHSCRTQNVILQNIQPQPDVKNGWLVLHPIQITVVGSYYELTGFIREILNGEYFVVLSDFKLIADKSFKKLTLETNLVFSQSNA